MPRYVKIGTGTAVIHDGTYGCCPDCKALLDADDEAKGPEKRAAAKREREA